jgi:protein phosphatase
MNAHFYSHPTWSERELTGRVSRPNAIDSAGGTHAGHVRRVNEDQYFVARLQRSLWRRTSLPAPEGWSLSAGEATLLALAGGGTGLGHAEIASAIAVESVCGQLIERMPWASPILERGTDREHLRVRLALQDAFRLAHHRIAQHAPPIASTLTVALLVRSTLYLAHVGDSRCYLLRDGALTQLTSDHGGRRVLGGCGVDHEARFDRVSSDAQGDAEPGVDFAQHSLRPHDRLLLCSDGLTKHLADAELAAMLGHDEPSSQICQSLLAGALARGGSDNVSVVVTRM